MEDMAILQKLGLAPKLMVTVLQSMGGLSIELFPAEKAFQ